jgi:hypothetical protein
MSGAGLTALVRLSARTAATSSRLASNAGFALSGSGFSSHP